MFDWSVSKEEEEEKQTNKIGSLLFEAMVDTFFFKKEMVDTWMFKILIRKIMNLALLFIVTWKSKDGSYGIIKL